MNKAQLANRLAERLKITQKTSENYLNAVFDLIIEEMSKGNIVNIAGFGAFMPKYRHARAGVNPLNPKEKIEIPATVVAKFKAGSRLKNALKNSIDNFEKEA